MADDSDARRWAEMLERSTISLYAAPGPGTDNTKPWFPDMQITPQAPLTPLAFGWQCPRCAAIHAPTTKRCDCNPATSAIEDLRKAIAAAERVLAGLEGVDDGD